MADAVSEQPTPKREEQALVIARRRAEAKVPRHRFGLAYLLLAALLGAGVGLFVVFLSDHAKTGQQWSAWKPTQGGVQRFDQIAKNVGREYALPGGRQLVGVLSSPPVVQGQSTPVPLRAIAVRTGLAGETSDDASFYGAGDAWAYVLCGFGTSCAISQGKPSVERYDLLRREALELALYTFKYNHSVQSVLAYMPPAQNANSTSGDSTSSLVFLRRDDLKQALDEPLKATLTPPKTNLKPGQMSAGELARVRRLTDSRVFNFNFQQLADGTAIVVLDPIKA